VAVASLATAYFIPDRFHPSSAEMVSGMHRAFIFLGVTTALSAFLFRELKSDDGDNVSMHGPARTI
jgi:hypothetical protein